MENQKFKNFPSIMKKTTDLVPYARNSRIHSPPQIEQICNSIKEFGFTNPIICDESGGIIAGHGRVMAAKRLKIKEVPCVVVSGWSEAQKKAYVIADNKLALNAEWDEEMLALEFAELENLDFDLSLTGFDLSDVGNFIRNNEQSENEDDAPEPEEKTVTSSGDVWVLGNHRVMCGDSTNIEAVQKLMNGQKADMVFTDPPYGISIVSGNKVGGDKPFGSKKERGTVGASNIVKANLYAPVAGDDSIDVAIKAIQLIKTLGAKVEIIWGGNYYANVLENSSCWIVWDKDNTGNFADAELAWTNQKTSVRLFKHTWNGMIKASERGERRVHPTQKPVALAEWCFEEYGKDCLNILDLFGGSGFTLIAAENKNKNSFIMELSPHYVDVIVKRWQNFTKKQAVLESTGESFNDKMAKITEAN